MELHETDILLPKLTLVVAISKDGFIADRFGRIPWHCPRDVTHFRNLVGGKHILLGRTTYEQMLGWFPAMKARGQGVTPLVLTSRALPVDSPPNVRAFADVSSALACAGEHPLVVCGGATVYQATLPACRELWVTEIDCLVGSGVRFPQWSHEEWQCVEEIPFSADTENSHGGRICRWVSRWD
jgi:dihydrofolate reductase